MELSSLPHGVTIGANDSLCPKRHGVLTLGDTIALAKGRVHEVLGESADCFALTVAANLKGPVIWIGLGRDIASLNPCAVQDFIDPLRLTIVEAVSRQEALWSCEQALRAQGIQCVILELVRGIDLKESRRFQLAAEESGTIGLILISGRAHTSAADTRWHCTPSFDGEMSWDWACTKSRHGGLGTWRVKWTEGKDGSNTIHLVATAAA
ncbi:MAG: hypothetical protein OXC62_10460 [Aestuariivita sp.]|nr:hypothetical protein [Aestuariivita sp.]